MTRHATLWAALAAAHPRHGARRPTAWTRAEVLACLTSWAQEHGRPPSSSELGPRQQLPGYETIRLVCGSVAAVYAALGWPYHGQGRVREGRAQQGRESDDGDGSWMNGEAVRETEEVYEWWEPLPALPGYGLRRGRQGRRSANGGKESDVPD